MNDSTVPRQKRQLWTIRETHRQQAMACVVDHFPEFATGQVMHYGGGAYIEVLGFEVLPDDVLRAITESEALTCLFAATGAVFIPAGWLAPVADEVAA